MIKLFNNLNKFIKEKTKLKIIKQTIKIFLYYQSYYQFEGFQGDYLHEYNTKFKTKG